MSGQAKHAATTPIPVPLSETEFTAFIFPHLSMPKRGPKCKLGHHCVFNLILWGLDRVGAAIVMATPHKDTTG